MASRVKASTRCIPEHPARLGRLGWIGLIVALAACASPPPVEPEETGPRTRDDLAPNRAVARGFSSLRSLSRRHGYRVDRDRSRGMHVLEQGSSRIEFDPSSRVSYFDGELVIQDDVPVIDGDDLLISPGAADRVRRHAVKPVAVARSAPKKPALKRVRSELDGLRIVLDAGHGGRDPGALGAGGIREKDVNLDVAREAARLLRAAGAEVVLTRDGDDFLSLDQRVAISNREKPDLFVSIHVNSAASTRARGVEIYRAVERRGLGDARRSRDSAQFARRIYDRLSAVSPGSDRGVKPNTREFRVVRRNQHPAILVELGFLSNPEDRRLLARADYRNRLARAVVDGIRDSVASRS